jgi:hypothetical protein
LSACKIETPVLLLDQFFTLELTLMDQDSGCVHSIISRYKWVAPVDQEEGVMGLTPLDVAPRPARLEYNRAWPPPKSLPEHIQGYTLSTSALMALSHPHLPDLFPGTFPHLNSFAPPSLSLHHVTPPSPPPLLSHLHLCSRSESSEHRTRQSATRRTLDRFVRTLPLPLPLAHDSSSWVSGTRAEALIELDYKNTSVFSRRAFPVLPSPVPQSSKYVLLSLLFRGVLMWVGQ